MWEKRNVARPPSPQEKVFVRRLISLFSVAATRLISSSNFDFLQQTEDLISNNSVYLCVCACVGAVALWPARRY